MTFSSDLIQIRSVFQREMPVNQQLIWISDLNLLNSRTKDCSVSICRCKSWTVIIWLASCLEVFSLKFWHITIFFPTIIIMQLSNNTGGGGRISVTDWLSCYSSCRGRGSSWASIGCERNKGDQRNFCWSNQLFLLLHDTYLGNWTKEYICFKTILWFVKIQPSPTNKVRRHTKKLSIVTLWTRFYVLASVWVSGIIETKHLPR